MLMGGKPEKLFADRLRQAVAEARDVLDIGTSQRFAKELRPYESLFAGKNYIAAGFQPAMAHGEYNCDRHEDIQAMTFPESSFDAVLCIEVLEHVADPFAAARELHRVLRTGGFLFLTTPFLAQYHGKGRDSYTPDHELYPDFWRFTHQGLERLFSEFHRLEVQPLDGPIEFRLKQFYLTPLLAWPPVRNLVDRVDRPRLGKATTRHLVLGVK